MSNGDGLIISKRRPLSIRCQARHRPASLAILVEENFVLDPIIHSASSGTIVSRVEPHVDLPFHGFSVSPIELK